MDKDRFLLPAILVTLVTNKDKRVREIKIDTLPDGGMMQSIEYHKNGKVKMIVFRPLADILAYLEKG